MPSLREFVSPTVRNFDLLRPRVIDLYAPIKRRLQDLHDLIRSDLYRYAGKTDMRSFLTHMIMNPGFKYSFWMRVCSRCSEPALLRFTVYPIARFFLSRYKYKYGLSISFDTRIGSGFYIGHFGGIVVNRKAIIGKNCNISHGVTIGETYRGERAGCPVIGDNVYIGPGAKIIGRIFIGDNAAIGANCVVTKDVPPHAVVVGVPGRVISYKGSADYVCLTDYGK